MSFAVTFAPATAAPEGSETTPLIAAVTSWAWVVSWPIARRQSKAINVKAWRRQQPNLSETVLIFLNSFSPGQPLTEGAIALSLVRIVRGGQYSVNEKE